MFEVIKAVIDLLCGVALFLFGMSLMGDGLKRVAGNKLEIFLYKLSGTPLKGFLLGTGVTAVIQSSSATSVMVVGFVNSNMMKVKQAIPIILGAILGTSITGWVICLSYLGEGSGFSQLLSTATLTGLIAIIGIYLRMFCKTSTKKRLGDILLGFVVLMTGMSMMSGAVKALNLSEQPWFTNMLTAFSNPIIGILVGTAFTAVLQSASAAVGILQALSITGGFNFDSVFPMLIGIGIGASIPVLLTALGATIDGKRTAWVYLIVEIISAFIISLLFYGIGLVADYTYLKNLNINPFSIAAINSVFRLARMVLLLPFTGLIEKLVKWLIRDKKATSGVQNDIMQLEERFLMHPALAIEQSRITINNMAKRSEENLVAAFELLTNYSDKGYEVVQEMESEVDRYEDSLGSYLVKITGHDLTPRQNEDVSKYLHTLSDFERISDHAVNIADTAQELSQKNIQFSEEGEHELRVILSAISEIVNVTVTSFVDNNLAMASRVEPLEELIDNLCDEMKLHHIDRLQKGKCTLMQGFVFNDLLTNFERISDHCSNIAVAMIELQSDSFDTHEYLNSVKELRSGFFDAYYQEYSERYKI
ncbi:MAG: Na/Pi cotransporter family protein [Clostridia bacterium]|nr:Na/Pi cotransporter family protein [Clostridia bacterium]